MRIVGGRLRGRALVGPEGSGEIRPTADRLRESVFNVLAHGYGDPVPGASVLDLFAGTGAMGLEALSRGAAGAVFVDTGALARGLIRANVEALGLGGVSRVFRRDATALGPVGANAPATLVFCDPPYGRDLAGPALLACLAGGWLAPGALAIVEETAEAVLETPDGFTECERRRYGGTAFLFLRRPD